MRFLTTAVLCVAALPTLSFAHNNHINARAHHHARQVPAAAAVSSKPASSPAASAPSPAVSPASSPAVSPAVSQASTPASIPAPSSAPSVPPASVPPASASGGIGPSVSLLSTNPTAIPLSSIIANAASQVTHPLPSTPVAGAQPTLIPSAPPLPNLAQINPANYPVLDKPPPTDSPQVQQWIQEVQNSGVSIPNISPTLPGGCPANLQAVADDANRCWWTCGGCTRNTDITTCPDKLTWGLSFDDGPSPYTADLLTFLDQSKLKATFFSIGSRAISLPGVLQAEYMSGHQIGVHTWSHPALTTLTNDEIIAELGWTKQVIHDILGVTPNMFRPPYGDIDDRVRAICIAMGLSPVIWTRISPTATFDTDDFNINSGLTTVGGVLTNWENILGNASTIDTGFITLEHDLFEQAVDVAIGYILPDAMAHSFKMEPVITCINKPLADAYIETNDNKTNPPVGPGSSGAVTLSSGAPGSAQATGASASSNTAVGTGAGLSLLGAVITAMAGFMAGAGAFLL